MNHSEYKKFIDGVIDKLHKLGIDTSVLYIDHLGYQASSFRDYENTKSEFGKLGMIKHDVWVGERKVAIFKLFEPLKYLNHNIEAIEIVSPKEELTPDTSSINSEEGYWEHVEIVPGEGLEAFMNKYPNLSWETGNVDRDIFPMLVIKLDDKTRVKFPRRGVLEEVERIKSI